MKIIQNYIPKISYKGRPQFTSNPEQLQNTTQAKTLPEANKDYNVRIPIAYNHIEDIKLNDELSAKCYKLANGQKVVIIPKKGTTVIKTYVNTGSFNEPDNLRGISHYIEHNLFNGSEDLGDKVFFDEVNKIGAETNASTSFANTNYYIKSSLPEDKDLENKIQLHAGMLQSPKFLLDKLEKEKKIVNSEINMCVSENENLGLTQTVKNLFNIKSTSKDLVAGNTNNISALTREDVVNYFNSNYYPANMTTVISGDVDPNKTIEFISKYFNSTKVPQGQRLFEKMTPIEKAVRQDIISPKSKNGTSTVFIGFAGPQNNNTKDKIHLQALNILAGGLKNSRISDIERKYGICVNFGIERLSSKPENQSMMLIESIIPENKTEFALKEIYKKIEDLSKNPPSEEELTAIKNKMKKSHDKAFETSDGINYLIGNAFLNDNIAQIKDFDNIVNNMSAQDIIDTAKKYMNLNKAALTVVHPNDTTEEEITNHYQMAKKMSEYKVSFTGINKDNPINIDNIKTYRTNNNFEVVFNNAATNTIEYSINILQHNWTPRKAAISNILSDILKNAGTLNKTIKELSKTADKYAINCAINANEYGISLNADFPANTTKEALEYFNERIKNPNFNQKDFNDAVKRIKDEYSSIEVNPYDKFYASMYKGTALACTPKEILDSLDSITLDDVKAYYKKIFENGQGKIVATGPFNKNPDLKNEIFRTTTQYPVLKIWDKSLEKTYKPIEQPEVHTDINLKNQANIIQGFKYKNTGNIKDENCVALLNEILGGSSSSRLFSDLREKRHLAYAVSSNYKTHGDMGVFSLMIGTTTENKETGEKTYDNIQKAINGFNENINKIKTEKVSQAELESAKKRLKSELYNILEYNDGKNALVGISHNSQYGIDYLNKRYQNIDSITVDDIYYTANNIFNSKPVYSLTGTKGSIDANKEYLESLVK